MLVAISLPFSQQLVGNKKPYNWDEMRWVIWTFLCTYHTRLEESSKASVPCLSVRPSVPPVLHIFEQTRQELAPVCPSHLGNCGIYSHFLTKGSTRRGKRRPMFRPFCCPRTMIDTLVKVLMLLLPLFPFNGGRSFQENLSVSSSRSSCTCSWRNVWG